MRRRLAIIFWTSLVVIWVGLWVFAIEEYIYDQPAGVVRPKPGE